MSIWTVRLLEGPITKHVARQIPLMLPLAEYVLSLGWDDASLLSLGHINDVYVFAC